jgi:lipopolysaccharide/colanic/teichoic acid biosynthesis glycosyltransferase
VVKSLELVTNGNGYANDFTAEPVSSQVTGISEKTNSDPIESQALSTSGDSLEMKSPVFPDVVSGSFSQRFYLFLKRVLDVVGALLGIIIFLPFFLIIPIVIKTTSKGPVLFKQKRIGYGGKPFTFLKFRTMRIDSKDQIHREYVQKYIEGKEKEINNGNAEKPLYKLNNDPRITKVGFFLRKTSLDELPQFFNVLAGNMSLVGPRPPIPYEVEFYKDWHLRRIIETKPGITGLWQVYGRNRTTFDEMVRLDLQYVKKQSFLLNLKILLKTITVLFNTKAGL